MMFCNSLKGGGEDITDYALMKANLAGGGPIWLTGDEVATL